jgi:hypothetical protein
VDDVRSAWSYVGAWWSFDGIGFGANKYVERVGYVTGDRRAVKDGLSWILKSDSESNQK